MCIGRGFLLTFLFAIYFTIIINFDNKYILTEFVVYNTVLILFIKDLIIP